MAKRLKEISTGDIYPWSESWAKDPRFAEIDQVEMIVPDPVVSVENGKGKKPKKVEDEL